MRILGLLGVTVGLPYFVLSTGPFRLFALSNSASLLALVTYPLVVERAWTTRLQQEQNRSKTGDKTRYERDMGARLLTARLSAIIRTQSIRPMPTLRRFTCIF